MTPAPTITLAISFLTPIWALLAALTIPLVVLYFLKLRRDRLKVPSLVLWQQVINDSRVNSPFQRFKKNILLLLQLIMLILLVIAAMQPYRRGDADVAERLPILIDRSASMAALDREGGKSRLDVVKEQLRNQIDGLRDDQYMSLIAFGKTARQLTSFTNNKRELRAALDDIEIEDVSSDLTDGLRITEAMWRTAGFDRVLLMSDGNVPANVDFALPFKLDYQRLPVAGRNMGITALNARRTAGGTWAVFVNVQGTGPEHPPATLELIQDGQIVGQEEVILGNVSSVNENNEVVKSLVLSQRLEFRINGNDRTSLELRLKPAGFDALESDNRAYLELNPTRSLTVYVSPSLEMYRVIIESMPGVRVWPPRNPRPDGAAPPSEFDLVVSDKDGEPATPAQVALYVGVVPTDALSLVHVNDEPTGVVDWVRTNPLLEHVELTDLTILGRPVLTAGVNEKQFEELHYAFLAHAQGSGPLILQKNEAGKQAFYLVFHTDRSTLPYRVGFPILVSNVVRIAMLQAGLLEIAGDHTGVLPAVERVMPKQAFTITGPGGDDRDATSDATGVLSGIAAPHVGRYIVKRGGTVEAQIGVSLLDAGETIVTQGVDNLQVGETSVAAESQTPRANYMIWPILAGIALLFLLLEWWYYQRKPGGWSR